MEKKKQKPYSEFERQLLVQLVQSKIGILENRKTDAVSQKKKHEAWEEITMEFNSSNVSHTSVSKQLKKMWQNMKAKTRDAKTQRQRTGGGPAPPEMGPMDTQVITVMPHIMPTIPHVPIDCDTLTTTESGTDHDNDDESWRPKRARASSIDDMTFKYVNPLRTSHDWTEEARLTENSIELTTKTESTSRNNQPSFKDLKKKLLWQELDHNKKKFEIEMEHLKLKNQLEIEFLQQKYKLSLEILQLKNELESKD